MIGFAALQHWLALKNPELEWKVPIEFHSNLQWPSQYITRRCRLARETSPWRERRWRAAGRRLDGGDIGKCLRRRPLPLAAVLNKV